uniref:Methyltransferase type 11 domain-containing protein n=1 Tax=Helicotheca tamesis TaxID=374047 RepID=A0A7S2MK60_9STRA|mmetsp:Transcript_17216/g.23668  ORF Transcript_17216/g.23668 Transcript_17216/m.23668 type:complete len:328 (+) Transcript_17216:67-1050(+)|eukprot:CAMPEP_0185726448 /NCGR_PEP_ID=MMETSP1171-20130828/2433_1 /TAXON_ID=374046 /ORGANISM="Helicotheca tamensis, Strain CCMP826" /LENGTH=327 /DNA_ID=CAMNT_0028394809 /DNA_START=57 /DNA_END=1040 /DNA_ORIENTATION=-
MTTDTRSSSGRPKRFLSAALVALLQFSSQHAVNAFAPAAPHTRTFGTTKNVVATTARTPTHLHMGLDAVTYLRTEWISAALCTNQTPRAADVCLQLGTEDGRAVTFVPKTIRTLITSSAEADGKLTVAARRQLKQQADRRQAAIIEYVDQRADDLSEVEDESVDVVISLQAADRMRENGLDWKRSVRESGRVLKPGGRLLFVEKTEIEGEEYLAYVENLVSLSGEEEEEKAEEASEETEGEELEPAYVFEEVAFDDVDFVIVPHVAGIAIKSEDAGLTPAERAAKAKMEEEARMAELSLSAFERGSKKRRKKLKKKKKQAGGAATSD